VLQEVAAAPGVRERAVSFESTGKMLRGVLALPEGERPPERGAVLLHGWGTYRIGPHAMLVKLARELASRGAAALRFDLRGRGESGGRYAQTGLDEMINDAVRAAAFLRKECGASRIVAAGLCSGANVALGAAAAAGAFERVAALSALPFQSHRSAEQSLRRTGGKLGDLAARALRPSTWLRFVTGRVRVLRVLKNLFGGEGGTTRTATGEVRNLKDSSRDLMGALAGYRGRVLFVWGGADAEGAGARRHFEGFAGEAGLDARFHVVEGSNHNFYSLAWEREAVDTVAGFLLGE